MSKAVGSLEELRIRVAELEAELEAAHPTKALRGFFNSRRTGTRKQRTYTPQAIIDAVLEVWPYIGDDPCSGPDSLVPARRRIMPPEDGLAVRWRKYAYVNPPFDKLKRWVTHTARHRETMLLLPVRTNRRWVQNLIFPDDEAKRPAVCWLHPVCFEGHKDEFPVPVALVYTGERLAAFSRAFAHLGKVTLLAPARVPHLALVEAA